MTQLMYLGAGQSVCLTNDRWGSVQENLFEIMNYAFPFGEFAEFILMFYPNEFPTGSFF